MEHPPKQGLKPFISSIRCNHSRKVLMEHPPKQGLKHLLLRLERPIEMRFNGTSTKTRIETALIPNSSKALAKVLMEHPPKQGLKLCLPYRRTL